MNAGSNSYENDIEDDALLDTTNRTLDFDAESDVDDVDDDEYDSVAEDEDEAPPWIENVPPRNGNIHDNARNGKW